MNRLAVIGAVLCLTGLGACANMTPSEQRALGGTAIGAAGGAAIGAATGSPATGAAIGAGAGLVGGLIADQAAKGREERYYYGERYDDRYYEDGRRYDDRYYEERY